MYRILFLLAVFVAACLGDGFYQNGNYELTWTVQSGQVTFTLKHSGISDGMWTGVAWGTGMRDLDFIEVSVNQGQVSVTDKNGKGWWWPEADTSSNVQYISSSYVNGVVTASFSRSLQSFDTQDKTLNGCLRWWFPVSGGFYQSKHFSRPVNEWICEANYGTQPQPQAQATAAPASRQCTSTDNSGCQSWIQQYMTDRCNPSIVRWLANDCCQALTALGCSVP